MKMLQKNKKVVDKCSLRYYYMFISNKDKFYRKEVVTMLEREEQILKTFAMVIPKLSERDKGYLLGLGEGMAIKLAVSEGFRDNQYKDEKTYLNGSNMLQEENGQMKMVI